VPTSASRALFSQIDRLNITAASRIHILEPQWNPSLERQAIGRAVRLGQTKRVKVVRYITAVSIEEVSLVHKRLENLILIFWKKHIRHRQEEKLQLSRIGFSTVEQSQDQRKEKALQVCSIFHSQSILPPKLTPIAGIKRISIATSSYI
jgi:hypothetical protein